MLYIIYATTTNYVFGEDTHMLWECPKEQQYFRRKTSECVERKQNAIIMGRKTADSLPYALKNRLNVVVTSKQEYRNGFVVASNIDDAISKCINDDNIYKTFVIGGKNIIRSVMNRYVPRAIYVTRIHMTLPINENTIIMPEITECIKTLKHTEYEDDGTRLDYYKYKFNLEKEPSGEQQYLEQLKNILINGEYRKCRNGMTLSLFGEHISVNITSQFPLLTTKKMFLRGIFEELKFFLLGKTNTLDLFDKGVRIWEKNTTREFIDEMGLTYNAGDMGPMYGYQLRNFDGEYTSHDNFEISGHDQLKRLVEELQTNCTSRRLIMTTYNPKQADKGVLYPCHGIVIQFYVRKSRYLDCVMHQRSADMFLGVPFNIASYALLVYIIAPIVNLIPGKLRINFGDLHIYKEHLLPVYTQLSRIPQNFPTLTIERELRCIEDITDLQFTDLCLTNYVSHPPLKAQMIA